MKFEKNFDESTKNKAFTIAAIVSIVAIVLVVICVILVNASSLKKKINGDISASEYTESDLKNTFYFEEKPDEAIVSGDKITVSDLDFYDLYKEDASFKEISSDPALNQLYPEPETLSEREDDITTDGKHFSVVLSDGSVDYIAINPNITKNDYDKSKLFDQGGIYKYFEENKCVSFFGVDVCKDQDYIDFNKLKKAGCQFVMIRAGARGYQSGQISIDDYFKDNLKRATDAGLNVGVYFLSQAANEDEAVEEAKTIIENVGLYKLTYPVVYINEAGQSSESRTDGLSDKQRLKVIKAFTTKIKEAGLKPMIGGTENWLMNCVELNDLIEAFDIWLLDTDEEFPDFPYKYSMWQYNSKGSIDGISGNASFNISYEDFSLK